MHRWPRFILLGVLAFAVGTLFRLANMTGVGLFRMFGTLMIGVAGAVAAWTMSRWQEDSGKADLHERLASLPHSKGYRVSEEFRTRTMEAESLLERSDGTYCLIASSNLPNFRGRRTQRRVQAAVLRLAQWGGGFEDHELGRVLVLLRRRVRDEERRFAAVHGVLLVNADAIGVDLFSSAFAAINERAQA